MVLLIALVAIAVATNPENRVLGLVSYAWAGFGAAFGPVVLISLFWRGMTKLGAIAGMVTGAVTVLAWIYVFNLSGVMYEIVPGFIAATIAILVVSMVTKDPESHVTDYFDEMTGILKKGELPGKE